MGTISIGEDKSLVLSCYDGSIKNIKKRHNSQMLCLKKFLESKCCHHEASR